jgi:hypothetical protein
MEVKSKIKDIEEFEKLFKINVPVKEHLSYYLNTLACSKEYSDIYNTFNKFLQLEEDVEKLGYKSVKSYKLDYALPKILNYLKGTVAYHNIQSNDIKGEFFTKDLTKESAGKYWLLSIDISKANYSTFKYMDTTGKGLFSSWEELCNELDIHPVLSSSKSFRQIVFGNTNPNRLQRIQHSLVMKGISFLKQELNLSEDEICFVSCDEIVLRFNQEDLNCRSRLKEFTSNVLLLSGSMENVPLRFTVYELDKITKNIFVKTVYNENLVTPKYKSLFGVPGNKFYKYFKIHILKQDLDDRDLLFINDGEIAKWMSDEDSIEITYTPEGEYSLEEVKRNFSHFYEKLSNEVSGLSEFQKRKIINVVLGLCKSCMNADSDCVCWNDD